MDVLAVMAVGGIVIVFGLMNGIEKENQRRILEGMRRVSWIACAPMGLLDARSYATQFLDRDALQSLCCLEGPAAHEPA